MLAGIETLETEQDEKSKSTEKKSFRSILIVTSSFGVPLPHTQYMHRNDGVEWKRFSFFFLLWAESSRTNLEHSPN